MRRPKSVFCGSYELSIDSEGCIVFPDEWREFIGKDRIFYFAPTRVEDMFNLYPKAQYDLEYGFLKELAKSDPKARPFLEKEISLCIKEVADAEWRLHIPAKVIKALGAKNRLALLGGMKTIIVQR